MSGYVKNNMLQEIIPDKSNTHQSYSIVKVTLVGEVCNPDLCGSGITQI